MRAEYTLHAALTELLVRPVRAQVAAGWHGTASDDVRTASKILMQRDGTAEPRVDGAMGGRSDHG